MNSNADPIPQSTAETGPPDHARGGSTVRMTPAGLQFTAELARRRWFVLALNVATYAAMMWIAGLVVGHDGVNWLDGILLVAFAIGLPWTVLGFWNAIIGLYLLHGRRDPVRDVAPFAEAGDLATPIAVNTAVLMTLRNEDADRAIGRLRIVQESLEATGKAVSSAILS